MAQDNNRPSGRPRGRVTRRGVVAGAAWAIPVVTMAMPVRAAAASCAPGGVCMTRSQRTRTNSVGCANGGRRYDFLGNTGTRGVSFSNTTTSTTITGLKLTFWLRSATIGPWGTVFSSWSVPAYSGLTKVVNGVTYYGYVTNYGAAISPVVGTTIVRFNFAVCLIGSGERLIQTDAIVNGQAQQVITGVLPSLAANVTVTE